jgi:hypothetical protein
VIAFDAHVLFWSLDDAPPAEHTRHHIKEASFHGVDRWTVDLHIKIPESVEAAPLVVNFIGVQENAMWPSKQRSYRATSEGGYAMTLFDRMDSWLLDWTSDTVDAMMLGSVGGIVTV